jgi:Polyketide cyclase / dehydrase and lipid transport
MSVTVSIDVPQPREDVYAFLDVMANHEQFTDHMLVDWHCSGPAAGVGSKARVTTKLGGMTDHAEIEVIEAQENRLIRERNVANKGRRVATGTYELSDLPGGGTHVEFTFAFERMPAFERPFAPLMRAIVRRANERAMTRLADTLGVSSPV